MKRTQESPSEADEDFQDNLLMSLNHQNCARLKDLPHLRVRTHSTATKFVLCFAQQYACSACLTGTGGKPLVTKRQNFGTYATLLIADVV